MAGSLFSNAVITFFVNTKQAVGALGDLGNKFNSTTNQMLGAIGTVVGAKGLKGYYDELQRIVQLTEKWNLPVEDFSRFINLFAQFGGDAEGAMRVVNNLQDMQTKLALESDERLRKLSARIGVNLANKDYKGILDSLREVYQLLSNDPNRNAQEYLAGMIDDEQALLRLLRADNKEYEKATARANEMRTITKEQADELTEVDKKLGDIRQSWANIGYVAAQTFTPLVDYLQQISQWAEQLSDKAIKTITAIGTALGSILSLKLAKSVLSFLGISGAKTAAATTAGTAATGATTAGTAATAAGTTALGVAGSAIVGALWPTAAGEKPEELLNLAPMQANSISGDLADYDANEAEIQKNLYAMRQMAKQQLHDEKWGQSKIAETNNDNRSVTINIYGVNGAEDMMSRLRGLPMNNMSPILWK